MPGLPTIDEIAQDLQKNAQVTEVASPELDKKPAPEEEKTEEKVEERVAPPPPVEKKDPLAAKFAALSRREKESRERAQEVERQRQENDARAQKLEERERVLASAKRPIDILKAHNLSYADVTQDMLGSYEAPEPDPVDTKLSEKLIPIAEENKALKERLVKAEETLAAIQAERVEAAKRDVVTSIQQTAEANDCEMILKVGDEAYTLVQYVIRNYWEQHKKVLSYKEACDKVESYYVDRVSTLAETTKIKSRFAPPVTTAPTKPSKSTKDASESPNTLTQSLSQGQRANRPDIDRMPKHEALALLATQLQYK